MLALAPHSVSATLLSPQKHLSFPKKPLTPYSHFSMERCNKAVKLHLKVSNLLFTKTLSKKHKELPEKGKMGSGGSQQTPFHLCAPAWG